jgi:hypothetical protein
MLALLSLLVLAPPTRACVRLEGPPPTRYTQVHSPDSTWLGELDRADGTFRVYRTVDPFHAVWATPLPDADQPGAALAVLDAGVVVLVRERATRPDQAVVTIARASGAQTWTVAELGGIPTPAPAPARRDSCSGSRPALEWLERASIEGDSLVVDPLSGPPRRLSIAGSIGG